MTARLDERAEALKPLGWKGRKAEWITLVCLHSGVFTRTQATAFLSTHHERARRMVHALIAQGLAAEETVPRVRGIGRVCRIYARSLYRALGVEHVRHRRTASPVVLMRRLLSLEHVVEHPGLPWLPTEAEKVAAFDALGIDRELLPVRVSGGNRSPPRMQPLPPQPDAKLPPVAGLARRDDGRIAELFARGATQSGALENRKVK